MSCGLRDVTNLESAGLPALLVHTEAFEAAARLQAEMLGQPAIRRARVPHPVQDKSGREIQVLASATLPEALAMLTDRATGKPRSP